MSDLTNRPVAKPEIAGSMRHLGLFLPKEGSA